MFRFLLKGILHDRSRSLLPIIVTSIGVMLTVVLLCWMNGLLGESVELSANFNTGHTKVMTRAYDKDANQLPNDLAIIGVKKLLQELRNDYPDMDWAARIRFGGLIDFPDSTGETRAQGPAVGWGIDLFNPQSKEKERFNLQKSIVAGRMPAHASEALITQDFAEKFDIKPGDTFTLFGTTMDGSMSFKNFVVAGMVRFGSAALDKGAIIIDLHDAQLALDMDDAAGEIFGFERDGPYNQTRATEIATNFNAKYAKDTDEFAPTMLRLDDQAGMNELLGYTSVVGTIIVLMFVIAMSVVLWNAGLISGLRRYNEFGVRLALGEEKGHIYRSLLAEGFLIGSIASIIGTAIGLGIAFYMQHHGLDMSGLMKGSTLMMPTVARAVITPTAFYIGFIPGLLSTLLGNALSGIGIYKRKTAELFKELEN